MAAVFAFLVLFLGLSTYLLAHLGWSQGATGPVTPRQWWAVAAAGTAVTVLLLVLRVHVGAVLAAAILTELVLTLASARVFLARPAQ